MENKQFGIRDHMALKFFNPETNELIYEYKLHNWVKIYEEKNPTGTKKYLKFASQFIDFDFLKMLQTGDFELFKKEKKDDSPTDKFYEMSIPVYSNHKMKAIHIVGETLALHKDTGEYYKLSYHFAPATLEFASDFTFKSYDDPCDFEYIFKLNPENDDFPVYEIIIENNTDEEEYEEIEFAEI